MVNYPGLNDSTLDLCPWYQYIFAPTGAAICENSLEAVRIFLRILGEWFYEIHWLPLCLVASWLSGLLVFKSFDKFCLNYFIQYDKRKAAAQRSPMNGSHVFFHVCWGTSDFELISFSIYSAQSHWFLLFQGFARLANPFLQNFALSYRNFKQDDADLKSL